MDLEESILFSWGRVFATAQETGYRLQSGSITSIFYYSTAIEVYVPKGNPHSTDKKIIFY